MPTLGPSSFVSVYKWSLIGAARRCKKALKQSMRRIAYKGTIDKEPRKGLSLQVAPMGVLPGSRPDILDHSPKLLACRECAASVRD